MTGRVYFVKTEIRHVPLTLQAGGEQIMAAGKYQERDKKLVSAFGVVHQLFIQSGFRGAKNSGAFRLCIKYRIAILGRDRKIAKHDMVGSPAERRYRPDLGGAERSLVIDFISVGRECNPKLIAFVIREL